MYVFYYLLFKLFVQLYVISLYLMVQTISTVGYGDTFPSGGKDNTFIEQ